MVIVEDGYTLQHFQASVPQMKKLSINFWKRFQRRFLCNKQTMIRFIVKLSFIEHIIFATAKKSGATFLIRTNHTEMYKCKNIQD